MISNASHFHRVNIRQRGAAARAAESRVQVSPWHLLPQEAALGMGKVRGTRSVPGCGAGGWDGMFLLLLVGIFEPFSVPVWDSGQ